VTEKVELPPLPLPPASDLDVKPVAEWAKELKGEDRHIYAAARVLYGWESNEYHHASNPLKLTRKVFLDAVKAAGTYPTTELVELAKAKDD
jgi:hypothetical protein